MKPAKDIGGDFYDYFIIAENKLGFAIGDVSGKGVPAALFMSVSRTVLRTVAFEAGEPGDVLARVNTILARDNTEGMFVTLFYAILDLDTGTLQMSSAGHDDLFLLIGSEELEALQHTGPAVGLFDGAEYATVTRKLDGGDSIFVLTDGVTEAFNIDGRVFTVERLARFLRKCKRTDAKTIVEAVTREVTAFSAGTEQSDDITCLAVQFRQ
jgi:serine phosphatase RsbU (regulator of sigma subunit)